MYIENIMEKNLLARVSFLQFHSWTFELQSSFATEFTSSQQLDYTLYCKRNDMTILVEYFFNNH